MDNFEYKKRKKLRKEPLYIMICLLCLVVGGAGGYFWRGQGTEKTTVKGQTIFDEVIQIIENDFLDTTDEKTDLKQRLLNGAIAGLGDPYSTYFTSQEAQEYGATINGSLVGVGISFVTFDAGGVVLDVYKNTPAYKAGVLAGDLITHVQGTSVAGYTSEKIKEMVVGEANSEVTLGLLRNGKKMEVKMKRESVETSVSSEIRTVGKKKVGYLKITTFGEPTASIVEEALKSFQEQSVNDLVIDLRGNSGGYLTAADNILDMLLPENEIMYQMENKQGKRMTYKASDRKKYHFENGYILMNDGSASASEILISGLKEVLNYQLIGTKTFGKGIAQNQKTLSDSSELKYTNSKWLTPKGNWIHKKGIEPDYEVKEKDLGDFTIGKMEKVYKYDQVDNNIQYMQEMLKELGYAVDREDGYFSKKTQEALKAFEKRYNLKVDGQFDKNDLAYLINALTYHLYQENEDKPYQKVEELLK